MGSPKVEASVPDLDDLDAGWGDDAEAVSKPSAAAGSGEDIAPAEDDVDAGWGDDIDSGWDREEDAAASEAEEVAEPDQAEPPGLTPEEREARAHAKKERARARAAAKKERRKARALSAEKKRAAKQAKPGRRSKASKPSKSSKREAEPAAARSSDADEASRVPRRPREPKPRPGGGGAELALSAEPPRESFAEPRAAKSSRDRQWLLLAVAALVVFGGLAIYLIQK